MVDSGTITIAADKYLALLDQLQTIESELRQLGQGGFHSSPKSTSPPSRQETAKNMDAAMAMDIDVSGIVFKLKKKADSTFELAGPYAKWGWTHAFDYGAYKEESRQLVQAIEQYGSVQIGNRIYTLGGRDNKLLNFKEA